jgi:hypothetical protein
MSEPLTEEPHSLGKRGMVLLAVLAATVVMVLAVVAGPVSSANAETFCGGVTLGPNGQCHLPHAQAQDIFAISSYSPDRANCVALLGYYGEQVDSWVCAPKESSPWYVMAPWRPFGYYRAAVKNNNLSQSGQFNGYVYCCNHK